MRILVVALALAWITPMPVSAEPTQIAVRVLARGAKFIAGYEASMRIEITDADTGEMLARGMTEGTTGDTQRILNPSNTGRRASEISAVYETEIDLTRARRITVSATGPLNQLQAMTTVSTTQWLLPGRHLTNGDGIVLELPGLVATLVAPIAYQHVHAGAAVPLQASVTMMCGCPFSIRGQWRADELEVEAHIFVDGEPLSPTPLTFNQTSNLFEAAFVPPRAGFYEVEIRAWMASQNNAGVVRTAVFVD